MFVGCQMGSHLADLSSRLSSHLGSRFWVLGSRRAGAELSSLPCVGKPPMVVVTVQGPRSPPPICTVWTDLPGYGHVNPVHSFQFVR
jgi:hypothetical protein